MMQLSFEAGDGPLRILALGAHCDDIEIGCGGTLLRLIAENPGCEVRWVVFASNEQREAEARACAAAFLEGAGKAEVEVHAFRESYFPWVGAEIKDAFEALRHSFEPQLVFTHYRQDLHQDHRTISELSWNTFRDHLILEYEIPKWDGDLGVPGFFAPLSRAVSERKTALILEHFQSQAHRPWFTADTFNALLRLRGVECNAPDGMAEAFYCRKAAI